MHHKLPTDENLQQRGCTTVSICDLCYQDSETSDHLFFHCSFAKSLWNWLAYVTSCNVDTTALTSVLALCSKGWSLQVKDLITAAIINIIWVIWFCRNKVRFDNRRISIRAAIGMVIASSSLTGNLSKKHMANLSNELAILNHFKVAGHPAKAPKIIPVLWSAPCCGWIKANTDGSAMGCPDHAGGGAIFRDKSGVVLGCFADYYGIYNAFQTELFAAMTAIEIAHRKGLNKLWLECDSCLVVQAFSSPNIVPSHIRIKWKNCLDLVNSMHFRVSHIFREDNSCADKLASYGVDSRCYSWWNLIPNFIRTDFFHNRWGFQMYRFS